MVSSIVVAGVLTCCALLHSMCNLKAAQLNVPCRLGNLGFMSSNIMITTKNICCTKGVGTVDHSSVSRYLKKFCLCCKNFDDQARSGRFKTVDSEAEFQVIESILWSSELCHLHNLGKSIQSCQIIPHD